MANAFTLMWPTEYLRWLRRVGDNGPLSVLYGGPHQRMPSLASIQPGDIVHVVSVQAGALHLIASLCVAHVACPACHVRDTTGLTRPTDQSWNRWFLELKRSHPAVGHRVPVTCADEALVAASGSAIEFDRRLPAQWLPQLRLGPKPGREKALTGLDGDQLKSHHTFHGHARRLSQQSAEILAAHAAPRTELSPRTPGEHHAGH